MEKTKFALTEQGYQLYKEELEKLITEVRPQVLEDIETARSFGDLSENADYDAARNKQSEVESRIAQLEHILNNCVIEELATTADIVALGNYVELLNVNTNEKAYYRILGSAEAKPLENIISNKSPLALAILGKKVGDEVLVKAPKPYTVEILHISTKEIKRK
ncbi:MAG: transcription elongation factor GreA [Bacilli bacterium]|jgi:transcription elongation factor GreA